MRVIVTGGWVNPRALADLLNKELNQYNIQVKVYSEEGVKKQILNIHPKLMKPVKYSPATSQYYDWRAIEWAETYGDEDYKAKLKYGIRMYYLHWYHWAMLNDTLTYIFDSLKRAGLIQDYRIRTAVGTIRSREWRKEIDLEYYPQYDPAFLKRKTKPQTRYKNIPIYSDRVKMLETLDKIQEAFILERLEPKDIPELEEKILTYTRAANYYKESPTPMVLDYERPAVRAWFKMKYGATASSVYGHMSEAEREAEKKELRDWLANVSGDSPKFKKFLEKWLDEVRDDIGWAIEEYGLYEEVLYDEDDAGFPYGLAKSLRTNPYTPKITLEEIKSLVKKETEKQEEYTLLEA